MKRQWTDDELETHFGLHPTEHDLVGDSKTDHNLLGFAVLLKYFQYEGRFPSQSVRFHKKFLARTNRITIDPSCPNFVASTALNRFIDPNDDWCIACHKKGNQQQHPTADLPTRPCCSIQDTMIVLKLLLVLLPHHSQDSGHGSFSWGQKRSDQEHLGPFPHSFTKDLFKTAHHVYNLGRQSQHLFFFLRQNFESSLLCLSFFIYRLDKV